VFRRLTLIPASLPVGVLVSLASVPLRAAGSSSQPADTFVILLSGPYIDRRPTVIAQCAGAADVLACVRIAREHDILVSVRGAATASPAKLSAMADL